MAHQTLSNFSPLKDNLWVDCTPNYKSAKINRSVKLIIRRVLPWLESFVWLLKQFFSMTQMALQEVRVFMLQQTQSMSRDVKQKVLIAECKGLRQPWLGALVWMHKSVISNMWMKLAMIPKCSLFSSHSRYHVKANKKYGSQCARDSRCRLGFLFLMHILSISTAVENRKKWRKLVANVCSVPMTLTVKG